MQTTTRDDTFEAFDPLRPSVAAMSQAIANVACHEIGHLLGLVHTQSPNDIMDVTASLRQQHHWCARRIMGATTLRSALG